MAGVPLIIEVEAGSLYAAIAAIDEAWGADAVVDAAAAIILDHTRKRFLQEIDPDGNPWPPSQAAIKRREAGGTGTLFDTGTLWRSIQELPATGDLFGTTGERIIAAGAYNKYGTEYGQFHQHGTKHLPVRKFMGINPDDIELFESRMLQRAAEALGV